MKKLIQFILIVAGAGAAFEGAAQVISYDMTHQEGAITRLKYGWTAFTNPCPPLARYYLNEHYTESKSLNDTVDTSWFGTFGFDSTCVYDRHALLTNNVIVTQTNASGTCSYGDVGFSASGSVNLTNGWTIIGVDAGISTTNNYGLDCASVALDWPDSDEYCLGLWIGLSSGWEQGTEVSTTNETTWDSTDDLAADPSHAFPDLYGHAETDFTLSDEYATADLLQAFPSQTNWDSGAGDASLSIDSGQTSVSMSGSRIKLSFVAPKSFTVPYVLHVHLDAVGTDDIPGVVIPAADYYQTNMISGTGDGTMQSYPSGKGLLLHPPYGHVNNGCADFYYGGSADISLMNWICLDDAPDSGCSTAHCPACDAAGSAAPDDSPIQPQEYTGMPAWWVTEPYINLWAADKPVEYTTSLGQKMGFTVTYKQRDTRPLTINGQKPFLPINGWNNSWYSYVHLAAATTYNSDGSVSGYDASDWAATVYEPNGGENAFAAGQNLDSNTGDQLLPLTGDDSYVFAEGFRLVHPDGSQDIYGKVSTLYPSTYVEIVPVVEDPADGSLPLIWQPWGIDYGGDDYEEIAPEGVALCDATVGTFADPITNFYTMNSGWPVLVMDSVTNYLPVTVTAAPSADALLTERIDPYGNVIHFNYSTGSGPYQLLSMVDYDGRTTTISYDTNGYMSSVNMPYGRTAYFYYAANTNAPQLLGITDAQGMSSSFSYGALDGHMASITTPYGTTEFIHYETNSGSVAKYNEGETRAMKIINPDGTGEMYAFFNSASNGAPFSYSSDLLPTPPSGSELDNGIAGTSQSAMYLRNSYYWGRQQFGGLSVQDVRILNQLNANDFLQGRMSHWKLAADGVTISGAVSMTRDPSPDGTTPGQMTWYGGSWQLGGDDEKPPIGLRLLPDGTTWVQHMDYTSLAQLTSVSTTCNDAYGNLSSRGFSYAYTPETYYLTNSDGSATSWNASWLVGVAGPGLSDEIDNSPDQLTLPDTTFSGSGRTLTYPHWSELDLADSTGAITANYYNTREQLTGSLKPSGLTTTNLYGIDGFLVKSIASQIHATNTCTFANGLLATRTDPNGLLTSYSWDSLERLTGVYYPDGTSFLNTYTLLDLAGQKDRRGYWAFAQFDHMRHMTSFTDRNDNTTSFGYCVCGGLQSVTDPQTNTTTYNRNQVGWVNSITFADAQGNQTTRTFSRDLLGRATNVVDSAGLNLFYSYNIQGLVTNIHSSLGTVFEASYDDADRPLTLRNAEGAWVTNYYDGAERLTDQFAAAGRSQHYHYTGHLLDHATDGLGNQMNYGYDVAERLAATADQYGYNTNGFACNAAGQLTSLADGNGNTTRWAYDIYGRKISKTDGNGVLVETNGYNADGQLTAHWTPAKGLTQYTYDANGNPLTAAYSSGPGITATYDSLNRIKSMSDAVGSSSFSYQNFGAFMGALATEVGPWAADTVTHAYANRLPQSLTLAQPTGSWTNGYSYDGLLRLTAVASAAGAFTYTYNGAGGQVASLALPGSSTIAETYDDAGQLLTTALKHGSTVLDSYGYAYDANGNRTSVQRMDNAYVDYAYDNLGQLTSAAGFESGGMPRGNENFGYQYDPAHNLAMRTNNTLIQAFGVDNANGLVNITRNNDLLTVAGSLNSHPTNLTVNGANATVYNDLTFAVTNGIAITSGMNVFTTMTVSNSVRMTNHLTACLPVSVTLRNDLNGNLLWDGVNAYDYDCANELTRITVTNILKTEFVYDGFGRRRVRKDFNWSGSAWTQTNEVHYIYDGLLVIQERSSNNVPQVSYTRGVDMSGTMQGAGGIGGMLARTDASGSAFYHADGNGNITAMVNASGVLVAKYLYDSFGNTLGMWFPLAQVNTYRYSSHEEDLHSGIYYSDLRYYDPNLQRWVNPDPIGEDGGINLYGFVGNNPVNYIDPYGLLGWSDFNPALLADGQAWDQLEDDYPNPILYHVHYPDPLSPAVMLGDGPIEEDPWGYALLGGATGLLEDAGDASALAGGKLPKSCPVKSPVPKPTPPKPPLKVDTTPLDKRIPIMGQPGKTIAYGDIPIGGLRNEFGEYIPTDVMGYQGVFDLMNKDVIRPPAAPPTPLVPPIPPQAPPP